MSVEQTDQLIQLILNSVLMAIACVLVLSGLIVRHTAINNRLQAMHREYFELLGVGAKSVKPAASEPSGASTQDRFIQMRIQLRQLRQCYGTAHASLLTVHYALLFLLTSTFLIALRTIVNAEWLITGALILFTVGVGVFLVGVGLALLDFHASSRPLWNELSWLLLSDGGAESKPGSSSQRPVSPRRSPQKVLKSGGQAKTTVV